MNSRQSDKAGDGGVMEALERRCREIIDHPGSHTNLSGIAGTVGGLIHEGDAVKLEKLAGMLEQVAVAMCSGRATSANKQKAPIFSALAEAAQQGMQCALAEGKAAQPKGSGKASKKQQEVAPGCEGVIIDRFGSTRIDTNWGQRVQDTPGTGTENTR